MPRDYNPVRNSAMESSGQYYNPVRNSAMESSGQYYNPVRNSAIESSGQYYNPVRNSAIESSGQYYYQQPKRYSQPPSNYSAKPPPSPSQHKNDNNSNNKKKKKKRGSKLKAHLVAATGEFVGTVLFLFFAFAWHVTVAAQTNPQTGPSGGNSAEKVLYISIGYGFSLLVNAWCFYRISGGLFNPAVLLGMVLTSSLPPMRALFLLPAELAGGIAAAALVHGLFPFPISSTATTLASNTSTVRGLFIEMFLTALLLFAILMLAAEKSKVTFMAPLGIGLALFVAELAGVFYTGGSLNPARSLGPAVVAREFPGYFWIYVVGPFLGSVVAAGYFWFVKFFDYEDANPGQDSAGGDFVE